MSGNGRLLWKQSYGIENASVQSVLEQATAVGDRLR